MFLPFTVIVYAAPEFMTGFSKEIGGGCGPPLSFPPNGAGVDAAIASNMTNIRTACLE
jgi:hypothetical protein